MQYLFLLFISLLFVACTPTSTTLNPIEPITSQSSLPTSGQTTDIDDLKILAENSIVGRYSLTRGAFSHGPIFQEITEGYLVIEEIEVDNYGYYYVTVVNKMSPEIHSGIFYEKGGKFVQKIIYDQKVQDGVKAEIETIDNINITFDENILKIIIDSNKKETTIWERDDGISEISEKIKKALEDAKYDYYKYYKEKCTDSNLQCAEHEYTAVND